jgi:hypothetical protein
MRTLRSSLKYIIATKDYEVKTMNKANMESIANLGEILWASDSSPRRISLLLSSKDVEEDISKCIKLLKEANAFNIQIHIPNPINNGLTQYIRLEGTFDLGYWNYGYNPKLVRQLFLAFGPIMTYFDTVDSDAYGFTIDGDMKILTRWETTPGG